MKQLHNKSLWIVLSLLLVIGFSLSSASSTVAQTENNQPLRVVTFIEEPWVMKDGNLYYGFHAELWDAIAKEAGLEYEWVEVDQWVKMREMVAAGEADVAVEQHAVRADRETQMDFTHEVLPDGMQVVILKQDQSLLAALKTIGTPQLLQLLGLGLLTLLFIAHLTWISEYFHQDSEFSKSYFPGIFEAMSWAVFTIIGERGLIEKHRSSRLISALWLFFILFAVSAFTAQLATAFTVNSLNGSIKSIKDLDGKLVGTWDNTKQSEYLKDHAIQGKYTDNMETLLTWLRDGEVDALLLDIGTAYYYTNKYPEFVLAGPAVKPGSIAYPVVQGNAELLEKINRALLRIKEDGTFDRIYQRYFGTTPDTDF